MLVGSLFEARAFIVLGIVQVVSSKGHNLVSMLLILHTHAHHHVNPLPVQLVEKSNDLGIASQMFYKQAKKANSCCSFM